MNPTDFSRLAVHTITTKGWDVHQAIDRYAAAGLGGITVWRPWLDGEDAAAIGERIRAAGLAATALCRGGFFPASEADARRAAIDDNRRALEQAAALGAPMLVLVCGAVPGQPLATSRDQIAEGIATLLPEAASLGVKLAIEPLHPIYAASRSAINTLASANELCERLDHPMLGVAVDSYHVWWDPELEPQLARCAAAGRLLALHLSDWIDPPADTLNDRGLPGEGCIDLRHLRRLAEELGFDGFHEIEIFSDRWWARPTDEFLAAIQQSYLEHC